MPGWSQRRSWWSCGACATAATSVSCEPPWATSTSEREDLLAATADDLSLPYVRAMSGAGHDAQEISAICPTAMVFVAGEHGDISHTPRYHSNRDACANDTDVLANAVMRLANQA